MPSFTVFKGSKEGTPKQSITTKPDELTGDNVLLKVIASGLCGTDLHFKHQDIVLGHEGVGVVEAVGPNVKNLKKGDRVGWGYETDSCGQCVECLSGEEIYCKKRVTFGGGDPEQGSFSSQAIWREAFLHPIPDNMTDEAAAPLQCAGATVYSALKGVSPSETVGIMGVGGLGHLAIQFASKMGLRVVVISGSSSKRQLAMKLGAHKFVALKDGGKVESDWAMNRLLVTTSAQPDWEAILPMMAQRAKIFPLSVDGKNLEIPYMPLVVRGIAIQGSLTASRGTHREMLAFAALHNIAPITEKFPMTEEGIQSAIDKLEKGDMQYRAVLIPTTA